MFSLAFCVPAPRLTTYPPKTAKKQLKIEDQAQKVHARSLKNARKFFFYILKKQKKSYILSRTRALYDKNSFPAPTWTGFLKLTRVWNIHALFVEKNG